MPFNTKEKTAKANKPKILLSTLCLSNIDNELVVEDENGLQYVDIAIFLYDRPNSNGSLGNIVEALPKDMLDEGLRGNLLGFLMPKEGYDDI